MTDVILKLVTLGLANMHPLLFADNTPDPIPWNVVWVVTGVILAFIGVIGMVVFFSFIRLWIQSLLTGANISMFNLVGMKLRNVDYGMIVRQKIALVQAGVKISTEDLEAHYLSRGNVPRTATAVIAAHKAGMDMPWKTAAAIDLAGRAGLHAWKTTVNPNVIHSPHPSTHPPFLHHTHYTPS